jgi:hypothetical protein
VAGLDGHDRSLTLAPRGSDNDTEYRDESRPGTTSYEIDVSKRDAAAFFDLAQLRAWAAANGVAVPTRGGHPQAIVERYKGAAGRRRW